MFRSLARIPLRGLRQSAISHIEVTQHKSPSSSSKLPNKELRISVEVEIVGDEIKFEIVDAGNNTDNIMHADSVLRKRRLKMKKHKYKKRRKAQRALRKRLGK
ncbi:unnamed protein product [Candida parapsilosis]